MRALFIITLLVPMLSFATSPCEKVKQYQLALSVHAANFLNAITTRTPEGGAFKKKKLTCAKECLISEESINIHKYEPNHPDANEVGYVEYPNISKDEERAAISTYAKAIKGLAKKCKKSAELTVNNGPDSFAVTYKVGSVRTDIFNFNSEARVVSWVREANDGESQIVNF